MDKEKYIIESWNANSNNWIDVIKRNGIESRKLATNQAIIDAVSTLHPGSVLDVGCGEGWLSKKLVEKGIKVTGVDVAPALIQHAKQNINGEFIVASYEDIYQQKTSLPSLFNVIVANFSLIGEESTDKLISALGKYLLPNGALIIQTLHPYSRKEIDDYITGWKEGSWDGFDNFTMPYNWYFRTMEDWLTLFYSSGFENVSIKNVTHPQTGKMLSVIFECRHHNAASV